MNDLFFARSQMAMSLAFHIVFAALGIGMPMLMVMAEGAHIITRKPVYLELSQRWAKGTAILFAVLCFWAIQTHDTVWAVITMIACLVNVYFAYKWFKMRRSPKA